MKSLFKSLGVALITGWLGLVGAANAAGVAVVEDLNGTGMGSGAAAISSAGILSVWGTAGWGFSTTPVEVLGWTTPVVTASPYGSAVLSDGTVVDLRLGGSTPLAGLSSVRATFSFPSAGGQWPDWAIQNNGALQAFVSVQGMSGVQTIVQPVGLSGVAALNVVPRFGVQGFPSGSAAWVVGTNGQLVDVQSIFDGIGISNVVVPISGMSNVVAVEDSPNLTNTFVARADGTVWAWGAGIGAGGAFNPWATGMQTLGLSNVSAVQVSGIANVVALKVTNKNVYALTATGEVWAWGDDTYGQLGQGPNMRGQQASLPVQVPGLRNIVAIRASWRAVLALASDGTVWAWGNNFNGQLGLGNNISVATPTQVPGLSGVTSLDISGGYTDLSSGFNVGAYAIAAKSDGSVWAWGDNTIGQLGNGTRVASNVPVRVLGTDGVGYLNVEPAILDVLANGVSVLNNNNWNGFTFANTTVGNTSAAQTMTYVNTGMVAWTGFSFAPTIGDFAQNNNCGSSLLPGASCTLNITFTPTLAGSRTVTIGAGMSFGNSQLGGAGGMTLSGTGVAPQAVLSASLGFGTQKTTTTTTKVVTLTNAGNASLTLGATNITAGGIFTVTSDTCTSATLVAGASCTMSVNFIPALAQAYAGTLTFASSNNPGGTPSMALSGTGAAAAAVRGDFDGNGKADVFWRNQTTGQNALYFMNGATLSSYAFAPTATANWSAVGVSDFNGDGKADILWRNQATGSNALWFMNAQNILNASLISSAAPVWSVAGTGDFDGDGKQNDILWFNTQTRQTGIWITNTAGQIVSAAFVYGTLPAGWTIAGVGDFDGDGKSDILWRNTANGTNVIWLMNGVNLLGTTAIASAPPVWSIKGVADFDADGKADIFWQDTAGNTYVWLMNGAATKGLAPSIFVGTAWTALQFADFNGDGKADILWRNAAGQTYVWLMNGLTLPTAIPSTSVPLNWTAIGK